MSSITRGVLIGIFIVIFGGLFALMPPAQPLPESISTSFTFVVSYLYKLDFLLPIDELLGVFALWVGLELVIFGWRVIKFIIRLSKMLLT